MTQFAEFTPTIQDLYDGKKFYYVGETNKNQLTQNISLQHELIDQIFDKHLLRIIPFAVRKPYLKEINSFLLYNVTNVKCTAWKLGSVRPDFLHGD